MSTVISITSGKGGTGKTSITGVVACSLALMGKTVLCVDMDVGLRNLDISLGLNDRALMDFTDVALGRCPLARAAVEHPDIKGLGSDCFALVWVEKEKKLYGLDGSGVAPMALSASLTAEKVRALLSTARTMYDYVLVDSPAGLGTGFRLAVCGADRVLVVSTNDASSLRDAQRTVAELEHIRQVHLIMNRIQSKLLRKLRATIDDAMDPHVILCANLGRPLTSRGQRGAALACQNIARRLEGQHIPIMRIR